MESPSYSKGTQVFLLFAGAALLSVANFGIWRYMNTGVWRFVWKKVPYEGPVAAFAYISFALVGVYLVVSAWQHLRRHGRGA